MFTGIIEQTGVVVELRDGPAPGTRRLVIEAGGWPPAAQRGESIAVSGCCLTLVGDDADGGAGAVGAPAALHFDVVTQTLERTTIGGWRPGRRVNLERSATATSLLGGHLVQGHVDGTGRVVAVRCGDGADAGGERRLRIEAPPEVAPFLVPRGSIAVDGVSLTVAAAEGDHFDVALIPETLAKTTLSELREGDRVNLEADAIAKLVDASVRRALGRAP